MGDNSKSLIVLTVNIFSVRILYWWGLCIASYEKALKSSCPVVSDAESHPLVNEKWLTIYCEKICFISLGKILW